MIHLHWHSRYSFLEWIGTIWAIVDRAVACGMPAIWLTDYTGMYGILEFISICKKNNIKPIVWVELPLVQDISIDSEKYGMIVLIAQNYIWYQNLLALTSIANTSAYQSWPRIDLATIRAHGSWVMILWWWHRSALRYASWQDLIAYSRECVEHVIWERSIHHDLADHNQTLIESGIPLCVGTNYHYVLQSDKQTYEVWLCIKDQLQYTDPNRRKIIWDHHIMSEQEILALSPSPQIDEMIAMTHTIASKIDLVMPPKVDLFPIYDVPDHITDLYETMKGKLII